MKDLFIKEDQEVVITLAIGETKEGDTIVEESKNSLKKSTETP